MMKKIIILVIVCLTIVSIPTNGAMVMPRTKKTVWNNTTIGTVTITEYMNLVRNNDDKVDQSVLYKIDIGNMEYNNNYSIKILSPKPQTLNRTKGYWFSFNTTLQDQESASIIISENEQIIIVIILQLNFELEHDNFLIELFFWILFFVIGFFLGMFVIAFPIMEEKKDE